MTLREMLDATRLCHPDLLVAVVQGKAVHWYDADAGTVAGVLGDAFMGLAHDTDVGPAYTITLGRFEAAVHALLKGGHRLCYLGEFQPQLGQTMFPTHTESADE